MCVYLRDPASLCEMMAEGEAPNFRPCSQPGWGQLHGWKQKYMAAEPAFRERVTLTRHHEQFKKKTTHTFGVTDGIRVYVYRSTDAAILDLCIPLCWKKYPLTNMFKAFKVL